MFNLISRLFGSNDSDLREEFEDRREFDGKAKEHEAKAKAAEAKAKRINEAIKATDAAEKRAVKAIGRYGKAVSRLNEAEAKLESRRDRRRVDLDALIEAAERGEIPMVEPPKGTSSTSSSKSSNNTSAPSNSSSSRKNTSKSETPKQKTIEVEGNEAKARAALAKVEVCIAGSKDKLRVSDDYAAWFLQVNTVEQLKEAVAKTKSPGLLMAGGKALVGAKWKAHIWKEVADIVAAHKKSNKDNEKPSESEAIYTIEDEAVGEAYEGEVPKPVDEFSCSDPWEETRKQEAKTTTPETMKSPDRTGEGEAAATPTAETDEETPF